MLRQRQPVIRRRPYHSPLRQRQAEITRQRIVAAARRLFRSIGYLATSMEAIAAEAGVSPKTVEAAFGSKRGLIAALVDPHADEKLNQSILETIQHEADPARRLKATAELTRRAYEVSSPEFDLMTGARLTAPELAATADQIGKRRRRNQAHLIAYLASSGALRKELNQHTAADELWALTGYELYRTLVVERGWTASQFEEWLTDVLIHRLLDPRPKRSARGRDSPATQRHQRLRR